MVEAWHGHDMASVNQTRPHYVNQMGKAHSKPLAARHGIAGEGHGNGMLCVCESVFIGRCLVNGHVGRVVRWLLLGGWQHDISRKFY